MKKIFIALSVVAVLFMAFPVHALLGTDDPVPGTDILAPFFMVEVGGTETTYIIITEVGGVATSLHWSMWDRSSLHLADENVALTARDVYIIDVNADIITPYCTTADKTRMTYTAGGKDWYAGYINFEKYPASANSDVLIGHAYQLDLVNGKASGVLIPAKEWAGGSSGTEEGFNTSSAIRTLSGTTDQEYEVFSPDALAYGTQILSNSASTVIAATTFRLLPRYYIYDTNAKNYLIVYTTKSPGAATSYPVIIDVCKEDESCVSKTLYLPYELNLIDVADVNPSGYTAGWWDITWPDSANSGAALMADVDDEDLLAYSYQQATQASISASWNVLFAVHREVFTTS